MTMLLAGCAYDGSVTKQRANPCNGYRTRAHCLSALIYSKILYAVSKYIVVPDLFQSDPSLM
jgi:hypothetical protein